MFVYIFFHVHPVGVGADLSCPYPRNTPKWCCVFPSLILQYIVPHPRNSTKWHCDFPPLALQFVIFRTSRQIEKERSKPMMFASLLCFMC